MRSIGKTFTIIVAGLIAGCASPAAAQFTQPGIAYPSNWQHLYDPSDTYFTVTIGADPSTGFPGIVLNIPGSMNHPDEVPYLPNVPLSDVFVVDWSPVEGGLSPDPLSPIFTDYTYPETSNLPVTPAEPDPSFNSMSEHLQNGTTVQEAAMAAHFEGINFETLTQQEAEDAALACAEASFESEWDLNQFLLVGGGLALCPMNDNGISFPAEPPRYNGPPIPGPTPAEMLNDMGKDLAYWLEDVIEDNVEDLCSWIGGLFIFVPTPDWSNVPPQIKTAYDNHEIRRKAIMHNMWRELNIDQADMPFEQMVDRQAWLWEQSNEMFRAELIDAVDDIYNGN